MKKFLFVTAFIFGVISFLWSFFCHQNEIELPFLGHLNADIRINIETPSDEIQILANGINIHPYVMKTKNTYVSYETNGASIYNLQLKAPDDVLNTVDNAVIFVGDKFFYFTKDDILNFKRNDDGAYLFPDNVKYSKTGGYITDKGILHRFSILLLSFFYCFQFYLFPWFWFILACFLYLKEKKPDLKNAIWWILILALLFRIQDNGFNFWSDELYTATLAANPDLPFMTTFIDPGNPPLFFILARFWMMIFGDNEAVCRILPTIFCIASIYLMYKFLIENLQGSNENFNSNVCKTAILGSFLLAVNIYSIHSAREFRAYQLGCLLAISASIYLFRIIKNNKNKDYWIYAVLTILMANTHYFMVLLLAGNFFWGIFQIKQKWKFFIVNCIGAISFLPYFLHTALNQALLNAEFNGSLKCPPLWEMWILFGQFFTTKIIAFIVLIAALVILCAKIRNNFSKMYFYALYICLFVYASSWVFSLFRPIIKSFYYINLINYLGIILAILVYFLCRLKGKYLWCLILAALYFSGGNFFSKQNLLLINFDSIFNYAYYDSHKWRNLGKKIGIAIHDTPNYALHYKKNLTGDEIFIMYDFAPKLQNMVKACLESPAQVIYMRLEGKNFPIFAAAFSQFAYVSMIRTERDVLVARLVKK